MPPGAPYKWRQVRRRRRQAGCCSASAAATPTSVSCDLGSGGAHRASSGRGGRAGKGAVAGQRGSSGRLVPAAAPTLHCTHCRARGGTWPRTLGAACNPPAQLSLAPQGSPQLYLLLPIAGGAPIVPIAPPRPMLPAASLLGRPWRQGTIPRYIPSLHMLLTSAARSWAARRPLQAQPWRRLGLSLCSGPRMSHEVGERPDLLLSRPESSQSVRPPHLPFVAGRRAAACCACAGGRAAALTRLCSRAHGGRLGEQGAGGAAAAAAGVPGGFPGRLNHRPTGMCARTVLLPPACSGRRCPAALIWMPWAVGHCKV